MADFYKTERVEALRAVDGKWLVINEDGSTATLEHDEFLRNYTPSEGIGICEGCGNTIDFYSDKYFLWEDGVYTCAECGGPEGLEPFFLGE